jgi:hypothetical protein
MTIQELIRLASNRITALNSEYSTAYIGGKIDDMQRVSALIAETQTTIDKLNTLA